MFTTSSKREKMISPEVMGSVYDLYHSEPTAQSCVTVIKHAILAGGIHVTGDENVEFGKHIDSKWRPFLESAIEQFYIFGFCPYILCSMKAKDANGIRRTIKYPVALPFGSYDIGVRLTANYEKEFFVPSSGVLHRDDSRVKVHTYGTTHAPDIHGNLRSPISHVQKSFALRVGGFWKLAEEAEERRCRPTIYTEQQPGNAHIEPEMLMGFNGGDLARMEQEQQYRTNQKRYDSMVSARPRADTTNPSRVVTLPEGESIASNIPSPDPRSDLTDIERLKDDMICRTLLVPKTMFGGGETRQNSGANSSLHFMTFKNNVDYNKGELLSLLQAIHDEIYPEENVRVLSLPGVPLVDLDTIERLYEHDIIDTETMAKWTLRSVGASTDDLDPQGLRHLKRKQILRRKIDLSAPDEVNPTSVKRAEPRGQKRGRAEEQAIPSTLGS